MQGKSVDPRLTERMEWRNNYLERWGKKLGLSEEEIAARQPFHHSPSGTDCE